MQYAYYKPLVVKALDYYSFGMIRRNYDAGMYAYRYQFNGKENDYDVKGDGDQLDYGMRIYDPRVGRFLSVDPLSSSYPWYTPYQFAGNSPLMYVDVDGAEGLIGIFLPNPFSEENTAKLKNNLGVRKGSFWEKAIDFAAGANNHARDLNNPATYVKGVADHFSTLGSNVGKIVTANSGGERAKAIASVLAPSLPAAEQTGEQLKAAVNGDMRVAGSLMVDLGFAVLTFRASGTTIQNSEVVDQALYQGPKVADGVSPLPVDGGGLARNNPITNPEQQATPVQQWQAKHHIATNKNLISTARGGPWTPKFEPFFKNAGLDINTASQNLVDVIDHIGPHPEAYHDFVFKRLSDAVVGLKPNTAAYKTAVTNTLQAIGKEAQTVGSPVNKLLTQ